MDKKLEFFYILLFVSIVIQDDFLSLKTKICFQLNPCFFFKYGLKIIN